MLGQQLLAGACVFAALGVHPFTTYPLSLALLDRIRPRPPTATRSAAQPVPRVALCVCAYNEERVIRAKADNMVSLREAVPGLELLVYVDASSDRTAEILRGYEEITIVVSPTRHGKTYGMNTLIQQTRADILVFSDANVMFAPDAVPRLLQRFDDPEVGCVCGHLVYHPGQRQRHGGDRLALLAAGGDHQGT